MLTRFHLELGFAGLVLLIGATGLVGSSGLDFGWGADGPQAGYFPFRVAVILVAMATLVAVQAIINRAALRRVVVAEPEGLRRVLGFGLPIIGLVLVAQWLGLYVAMALYLLVVIRWQGRRPWHTALGVALGVTVVTFLIFEIWFQVTLLKGPLEIMLGLG